LHFLLAVLLSKSPANYFSSIKHIMSFGVGLSDIFQALQVVKVTYDAWKDAPEKYKAISQRLRSLQGPLQHLATHYKHPQRKAKKASSQRDLDDILSNIGDTVQRLTRILNKHSGLKFWDRLRLSAHEVDDLSAALDRHILDLTCFSSSLGLQNDREIQHSQQNLQRGQDEILRLVSQLLPSKVPQTTIEAVADSVDSVSMSSSFMTEYSNEDDDPAVWRAFRRKAIAEGVTSRDLQLYEAPIHDILRTVAADRHRGRQRRLPSNSAEQASSATIHPPNPYPHYADEDEHYTYSPTSEEIHCSTIYPDPSMEPRGRRNLFPGEEWQEQPRSRLIQHDNDAAHMTARERPQRHQRQRSRSIEPGIKGRCSPVSSSRGALPLLGWM
jgi:hypothetical protein